MFAVVKSTRVGRMEKHLSFHIRDIVSYEAGMMRRMIVINRHQSPPATIEIYFLNNRNCENRISFIEITFIIKLNMEEYIFQFNTV